MSKSNSIYDKTLIRPYLDEVDQDRYDWVTTVFDVHTALWLSYDNPTVDIELSHNGSSYPIVKKNDFHCAVIPSYYNKHENNFWMTNNMARSTHGTFQIEFQKNRGLSHQITWIVGRNAPNEYYHKGCITTTSVKVTQPNNQTFNQLMNATIAVFYYGSSINVYDYSYSYFTLTADDYKNWDRCPVENPIYSNNPPVYSSILNPFVKQHHLIF